MKNLHLENLFPEFLENSGGIKNEGARSDTGAFVN